MSSSHATTNRGISYLHTSTPKYVQYIDSDRVDLRSDTITQPTPGMREAMSEAIVGDDVLGDDPTVIELQNRLASMFNKEAALFVPSGTMSNAIAIKVQTSPGDDIITERNSHIYVYEGGGYAALSGCSIALVPSQNGIMNPVEVEKSIRKREGSLGHYPNGTLVCVENTSNRGGGTFYPQGNLDSICEVAKTSDCSSHLDGARIFNAAVASGTHLDRMVRDFDSVSVCLSKGLGAPVGSVLLSSSERIGAAHRWRKMFGGGMRQAGIIAAAGIYAIENHMDRLVEDHNHAKALAESIGRMPNFNVDMDSVSTNMVYVQSDEITSNDLLEGLSERGIDVLTIDESTIRLVTHLHITQGDVNRVIACFESLS